MVALPISHSAHELDDRIIRQALAGYEDIQNGWRRFDTPLEIIKKTGRCRLVVAGTFHTAVFALAQGIPAVGLVKSTHYMNKFSGLVDQFGAGCDVVCLDDERLGEKLADAIDRAWESAEQVRPQLLEAAIQQIELGRLAYQEIYELVEPNRRGNRLSLEGNCYGKR